jgi:beta-lactam-binding protein with PASTA domain
MNGQSVAPGTAIKKGSVIDLILGDGLGQSEIDVPNLIGLSLREATFVLEGSSLNLGAVVADNSVEGDSLDAIVYRQIPEADNPERRMNAGEGVDVFITARITLINSQDQ